MSFVSGRAATLVSGSDIVDGIMKAFAASAKVAIRPRELGVMVVVG